MDNWDIELKKHRFISFIEDHYNPLNIIRSLGEKGIFPTVILIGEHPVMIPHCRYIGTLHRVRNIEEGYKILIEKYSNEKYKPFILCSDDKTSSFIDQHYDELKESFIFYNAGKQGGITNLQKKDVIISFGEKAGLIIPKSEVVNTGILPKTLSYPVITKVLASTMGAWKGDVYVCQNEEELISSYAKIKSPKLIIQEYINKVGEFCMEGFSINDGHDIFMPYVAEYIRFYNNSYGHYMQIIPFLNIELRKQIEEIFKLIKFNGIFEIEFMKGPDMKNYFLEINLRASTWNYALTVGGCNLPYFWAKSILMGRIPYEEMNIRKEPFTAMVEPADFFNNVIHGDVSFFRWIKEWMNTDCYYYYNKNDKMPYLAFWWDTLKQSIIRRLSWI